MNDQGGVRAIILAAGAAKRLGPELAGRHKCLADVDGRPIIDYQLQPLIAAGAREITVVVGYEAERLKQELCRLYPAARFRFVENADYAVTNTIWSLYLARDTLARGALLLNADVVMDPQIVRGLIAAEPSKSWLAVTRAACAEEEVKVVVDARGRVLTIGKKLDPADCAGEFIGAAWFSPTCGARYAQELESVAAAHKRKYFEFALDRVLREQEVCMLDVTDLPCVEVDFPEDLERARTEIAPRINRSLSP